MKYIASAEQEQELSRLFKLTNRPTKYGNCLFIEDIFLYIFDSEITYNGSRGDFMLTHQDIGYFNISENGKMNVIVYEHIINGDLWDAVIRLYKIIHNIK